MANKQIDLYGRELLVVNDICCEACFTAQEDRCVCRCGGKYHGLGRTQDIDCRKLDGRKALARERASHSLGAESTERENHRINRLGLSRQPTKGGDIVVSEDKILPEEEAQEFRKHYTNAACICGKDLSKEPISYYVPHSAGWTIKGEDRKAWLFVHCANCGYDMSIWKMGVPRE